MECNFRNKLLKKDRDGINEILLSTGIFYDFEIDVALEIVDIYLKEAEASGYYFYVATYDNKVLGYINFGKSPCTFSSWDIYWIAVYKKYQVNGLGSKLLKLAENKIAELNGENIWVETSSRPDYELTRKFYLKTGYTNVCQLPEFYGKNDSKVIFLKNIIK